MLHAPLSSFFRSAALAFFTASLLTSWLARSRPILFVAPPFWLWPGQHRPAGHLRLTGRGSADQPVVGGHVRCGGRSLSAVQFKQPHLDLRGTKGNFPLSRQSLEGGRKLDLPKSWLLLLWVGGVPDDCGRVLSKEGGDRPVPAARVCCVPSFRRGVTWWPLWGL